jgi:hypothetical protein
MGFFNFLDFILFTWQPIMVLVMLIGIGYYFKKLRNRKKN